jgi:tripartite ATP-independent transporter DctM subunit
MDIVTITVITFFGAIALTIIGIPIAYALGFGGVLGILFGLGGVSLIKLGLTPFSVFYNLSWLPLPLFILMACIISETTIGADIFGAANNWLSRIPGGLVVAGVWSQAVMSAADGSSGVSILTTGKVVLPQMERLGYNKRFCMGALLSGGVLGPLIPPSIPFIVYAVLTQQSISQLFMAGIVPGILLALMLSAYAMVTCFKRPELAPRPAGVSWKDRIFSVRKVWTVVVLMFGILGGIYLGVVTATEAAALGVLISLLIAVVFYRFRLPNLIRAMSEAATLTAMVSIMVIVATVLTFLVDASGIVNNLSNFIVSLGLPPLGVIIIINVALLVLGTFLDGLAIMLLSVPVFVPLIVGLGFDPVWFGVLMVVNIEIALITPPDALNLYLMSGTFREPVVEVIRGVAPFLAVLVVFLGILIAFPQLSLWLPKMMGGG